MISMATRAKVIFVGIFVSKPEAYYRNISLPLCRRGFNNSQQFRQMKSTALSVTGNKINVRSPIFQTQQDAASFNSAKQGVHSVPGCRTQQCSLLLCKMFTSFSHERIHGYYFALTWLFLSYHVIKLSVSQILAPTFYEKPFSNKKIEIFNCFFYVQFLDHTLSPSF